MVKLPLKLDSLDVAILQALSEDGRRSYRQIAQIVKASTPTVQARFERMIQSGLISRIAPIYNVDRLDKGFGALVWLKVDANKVVKVAAEMARLEEIKGVFVTTGEGNLLVKIFGKDYDTIQSIISDKIGVVEGVQLLSTQMITKTLKDEQSIAIEPDTGVLLSCDYCKGKIQGSPATFKVLDGERYFCCNTCLTSYKEKYGSKLRV